MNWDSSSAQDVSLYLAVWPPDVRYFMSLVDELDWIYVIAYLNEWDAQLPVVVSGVHIYLE